MTTSPIAQNGRKVVVRFLDGRTLKGTTQNFAPNKTEFHLYEGGDESSRAIVIRTESLKALFFVKSYVGDRHRRDDNTFRRASGHGRKIRVRFLDGEEIAGFTMGYSPQKHAFFLVPTDPDANNARVYIFKSAVAEVELL